MASSPDQPIPAALTPEEWARHLGSTVWSETGGYANEAEKVVQWALDESPDMSRQALAALCLHQQPFGFTHAEIDALAQCLPSEPDRYEETMSPPASVLALAEAALAKIRALLPPPPTSP